MQINQAEFIKSSVTYKECPPPEVPEYAFIGRSNVGKSSLINMLAGNKKLAKISSTPGKTQLINHFLINGSWYLTDLPGFGFAKVPVHIKKKWEKMIRDYLENRENLVCTFLLIDIRHEPLNNDMQFLNWLGAKQLPFHIVFTKADKLGRNKLKSNLEAYERRFSEDWDPLPPYLVSSSEQKTGKEEILQLIDGWNRSSL
jgi:GTP-binding protein